MGLKSLYILIYCLSAISFAEGLKCYYCADTLTSGCASANVSEMSVTECMNKTDTALTIEDFDESIEDSKYKEVCLRFYEHNLTPKLSVRDCGIIPLGVADPCEYVQKFVEVKACKFCTSDLCNIDVDESFGG